jgi:hypothetical protein
VFPRSPSPRDCSPGSSSRALRLLFRVSRAETRPACPHAKHLPGFPFPFAMSAGGVHLGTTLSSRVASVPSSLRSVLDVSHVLDGFLRLQPCGSISPRNRVRDSLLRGFPSRTVVTSSSLAPPLSTFATAPCLATPGTTDRPQGLLLRGSPDHEPWGFSPRPARSPLELRLLRVFLHQPGEPRACTLRSHRPRPCFRWPTTCCRLTT